MATKYQTCPKCRWKTVICVVFEDGATKEKIHAKTQTVRKTYRIRKFHLENGEMCIGTAKQAVDLISECTDRDESGFVSLVCLWCYAKEHIDQLDEASWYQLRIHVSPFAHNGPVTYNYGWIHTG